MDLTDERLKVFKAATSNLYRLAELNGTATVKQVLIQVYFLQFWIRTKMSIDLRKKNSKCFMLKKRKFFLSTILEIIFVSLEIWEWGGRLNIISQKHRLLVSHFSRWYCIPLSTFNFTGQVANSGTLPSLSFSGQAFTAD